MKYSKKITLKSKLTMMNNAINKLILSAIILLMNITLQAQDDRQNASLPVIGDKVLWSLSEATGWIKNSEGQWLEGKNIIYEKHLSAADKAAFTQGRNILGKDNFLKYEVRTITISGVDFLLLTKTLTESGYNYPSTKSGWKPIKMVNYIVFKKSEGSVKPHTFESKASTYQTQGYFRGTVDLKDDYLNKIALQIAENDQRDPEFKTLGIRDNILLGYKILADGKNCRFHIYSSGSLFDMQPIDHVSVMNDHASQLLDYYFECPKEKLDGLLKLIYSK